MLDIQIDGLQAVSQMQLWIIVQRAALKPFEPVLDRPADQIAENVMIKVELESNGVIEA